MNIRIERNNFLKLMEDNEIQLPKMWSGDAFEKSINELYNYYCNHLFGITDKSEIKDIKRICRLLIRVIDHYHNGFPSKAFNTFCNVMKTVMKRPFRIYQKTGNLKSLFDNDFLELYRIRSVNENREYHRKEIFHTPFSLRSKIGTCRYSIAGYPSLYLSTSLELCFEETKLQDRAQSIIASKFKLIRDIKENGETDIKVIELGIKPVHFIMINKGFDVVSNSQNYYDYLNEIDLTNLTIMNNYLYWYPIIAACSFIRVKKSEPFSSEYIIPQLLMQWIRTEVSKGNLYGIRYFSGISESASNMGFNYVFPVFFSNKDLDYCTVLSSSFKLTKPVFIQDCYSLDNYQNNLDSLNDLNNIHV